MVAHEATRFGGYGGPIEASDACGAWIASRHEPPEQLGEEETT